MPKCVAVLRFRAMLTFYEIFGFDGLNGFSLQDTRRHPARLPGDLIHINAKGAQRAHFSPDLPNR